MGLRHRRRRISEEYKLAIKRFRNQSRRNILAKPGNNEFIIVLDHLKPRYNIGKIFRSADAFGAREVHLIGTRFFDPAPAMGSFKWVPAVFHDEFDTCYRYLQDLDYRIHTLDPSAPGTLSQTEFPRHSAFIFGHEEYGFSFDIGDYDGIRSISIPQYGKVQSLNVSVAASLAMYEYVRQHDA